MNIRKKFLIVFLIISVCITILSLSKFESNAADLSEMMSSAQSFISKGKEEAKGVETDDITANFVGLGQALTTVGGGILVAVMTYMGIKYMISPPDKQAALKQQLIGVVFAGIVIFGAYGIWYMVVTIAQTFDQVGG